MYTRDVHFTVRLARDEADLQAAQRLRYDVFVSELGGDGPLVDHEAKLERDRFDPHFDHLLLSDDSRGGAIVGSIASCAMTRQTRPVNSTPRMNTTFRFSSDQGGV